ncbi:phosphodiester glycosidase family protein [Sphingomonas hankyongi]|uniref:Phosphodiester glycosidase family protein n=1 Tax=Sphingomonas hankyongi TaxID=2908209 RepID=A0ABT0S0K6_9SPHN|nr:phosphodiester glycosidase family protein [Sphingomonas hankyongi]
MRGLLIAIVLALCACGGSPAREVAASFCSEQTFEGTRFTVCGNKGGELRLFAAAKGQTPLRSFADLALDQDKVAFAMNAGMFDEDGRPIGLATANGAALHKVNLRDGPGNFHMKPNGVFIVTCGGKSVMIVKSEAVPQFRCAPDIETQSGPMLVIDGKLHPKIEADGTSRLIRNGVGVTRDGRPLFVISEDPVSFGKLARFFRDSLKTPNALFFDGSVSSLWDPANGRMDSHAELGPMIVGLKPSASTPDRGGHAKP